MISNYHKYKKYKTKYSNLKRTNELKYPYYNNFYNLTREKFLELVDNFKPKIINFLPPQIKNKESVEKYKNRYILIEENWDKNEELNNVTDFFTENCRIICRFGKYASPLEYWGKNKNNLLSESYKKYNKLDINFIRDKIYERTKLCNNFRISVAITVLGFFNARKWLDISAGWGDRLIAAIAFDVQLYCAVDPNDCLHTEYKKIIDMLVPLEKKHKYILIKDGFETAKLPDTKFDLVFSSPPFFDLEIYSESEKDSLKKYSDVDRWYNEFLLKSLKKAYDYLEVNGHMVLYMGEGINTNYIKRMFDDISKIMKYEGKIYYFYDNVYSLRRFYVWVKI